MACPELLGPDAGAALGRFKDHPAVAGYHLRDEPPAGEFAALADQLRRIRGLDPNHPCYVNLLPNYAKAGPDGQLGTTNYQEYVDRFLSEVPVSFVSFDYYPIVQPDVTAGAPPSLRPGWFVNLQAVTTAARKAGKPVWAFALTVPHGDYPVPTKAHLRLQVFANLAYGVQAIQYFTYWTPTEIEWNFHDAPIASNGTRTPTYELIKQINQEVQAMRSVFRGAVVLSVDHMGDPLPEGTTPYRPAGPILRLKAEGSGTIVSRLANGDRQFLVIVNRDLHEPAAVTVDWEQSTPMHRVDKDGSLRPLDNQSFSATLEPGDLRVLTWQPAERKP